MDVNALATEPASNRVVMPMKIIKLAQNLFANILNYFPIIFRGLGNGWPNPHVDGIHDHENHQSNQQKNNQNFGKFCHFFRSLADQFGEAGQFRHPAL